MGAQDRKRGDTVGVNQSNKEQRENALLRAAENGTLQTKLKKYLRSCRPPDETASKKNIGRLPNLAGFCASLGCGTHDAIELQKHYPRLHDHLCAVLEDEVLNYLQSPSLLNSYLKERLDYGDKRESEDEDKLIQPIFEHDIYEDGA